MNEKILLGKRIRELRKKQNLSQEKLAEAIKVEPATISNIENGKNYPSLTNLENIAKVLNTTFMNIFDYNHKRNNENLINEINILLKQNPDKIEDIYKITTALLK